MSHVGSPVKAYDFLLKFLLVGDSDVGKGEILASLQDGATESPYGYHMGKLLPPGVPPAAMRCLAALLAGSPPPITSALWPSRRSGSGPAERLRPRRRKRPWPRVPTSGLGNQYSRTDRWKHLLLQVPADLWSSQLVPEEEKGAGKDMLNDVLL